MGKNGAQIIFLPSQFRKNTGDIAWNVLTRRSVYMSSEVKDLSNSRDEIKNYIYTICGKQVLLDRDLAK